MKILIFSVDYKPMVGGIAVNEYELARNFQKMGNDVIVLTTKYEGDKIFDLEQNYTTIRIQSYPLLSFLINFLYLFIVSRVYKIDVIRCAMWYPCGLIAAVNKVFFGAAYIVNMAGQEVIDSYATFKKRIKSFVGRPLRRFEL